MPEIDPVILQLRADNDRYLAELRRTTRTADQQLGLLEKRIKKLEAEMRASSSRISLSLGGIASTLATYFTGRELIGLIDGFTRLQNQLKVAGLEGQALADVQERLFAMGAKYGVSVNALAELYGKASQAAKELGASQEQLLSLTELTSQSLLITGTSTEQASGAILGLSQALASGIVRAEEFNQINEGGLRPLLEAAAATERFGGSVAKLRIAVTDGKVSSQELYEAILANAELIEGKASKATLTLSGALTSLRDQLMKYVGESGQGTGATAALAAAIQALADNLDTLIPLLAVIATGLGVGFVTNAVRASVAAGTLRASLLAAFGGPVGLAITALTVGIGYLAAESAMASAELEGLAASSEAASQKAGLFEQRLRDAGIAVASVGDAVDETKGQIKGIFGVIDQAIAKFNALANSAAMAQLRMIGARQTEIKEARRRIDTRNAVIGGMLGGGPGMGAVPANLKPDAGQTAALNRLDAESKALERQARAIVTGMANGIDVAAEAPAPSGASPAGSSTKPRKSASGRDPADIERQFANELISAAQQALSARQRLAQNAEERADLELRSVELARVAMLADIDVNKDYSDTQKERLRQQVERIAEAEREGIELERQRQVEQEAADLAEERHRAEQDSLRAQFDLADSDKARKDLALQIFDAEEAYLRSKLEAVTLSQTANDAEKRRAQIALDALNATEGARRAGVAQANETEADRYVRFLNRSTEAINESIDGIKIDGLEALNDGLVEAIMGAESLGDVFSAVADQIIADLIRIAIQQAVIQPLADQLFGGGGFFAGLFGGGGPTNLLEGIPWLASGGPAMAGKPHIVGERGPELFIPNSSGFVVPNDQLRSAQGGEGSVAIVRLELSGEIDARIGKVTGPLMVEVVRIATPSIVDRAANETIRRANRPRL